MRINFGDPHPPCDPVKYLRDMNEVTRIWNERSGENLSVPQVEYIRINALRKLRKVMNGPEWEE
jgi:hypothetical protein